MLIRHKRHGHHAGQPEKAHLHHFIQRLRVQELTEVDLATAKQYALLNQHDYIVNLNVE